MDCDLGVETIATKPIEGQKPGTSGLRKKTKEFMEGTCHGGLRRESGELSAPAPFFSKMATRLGVLKGNRKKA